MGEQPGLRHTPATRPQWVNDELTRQTNMNIYNWTDVMGKLLSELPRFFSTWLSFLCKKDFDHFFTDSHGL